MTILLLPAPDYVDTLLKGGVCGSRVPKMMESDGVWVNGPDSFDIVQTRTGPRVALVLALDGQVPEGVDRLRRVLATFEALDPNLARFWFDGSHAHWCMSDGRRTLIYCATPGCHDETWDGVYYVSVPPGVTQIKIGDRALALATVAEARGLGTLVITGGSR